MSKVKEVFGPVPVAANGTYTMGSSAIIGGFLAKVSGTITVAFNAVNVVDAVPVTAGIYTPIPAQFADSGAVVTLAGGAAGTLFVG